MAKKKPPPKKGRPTKYSQAHIIAVEMMARIGMTDLQMSGRFGVAESTFHKWKKDHPDFAKAIKKGKVEPDDKVEAQLFRRALGYEYIEETETVVGREKNGALILGVTKRLHKHMPGDPLSTFYWLNNRKPEKWRQRQEIIVDLENNPVRLIADALKQRKSAEPPPK